MPALIAMAVDDALLQYGAIGILALVALYAVRVLFKRETDAYEREKERADRLEAELQKMNTAIQERYLVALNDAARAVADALEKMRR
jgi:hypothetical protein